MYLSRASQVGSLSLWFNHVCAAVRFKMYYVLQWLIDIIFIWVKNLLPERFIGY